MILYIERFRKKYLQPHRLDNTITLRELSFTIVVEIVHEKILQRIGIDLIIEWYIDHWSDRFFDPDSQESRDTISRQDSESRDLRDLIDSTSDLDNSVIYMYSRHGSGVILHEDIDSGKEKGNDRHDIESLEYAICDKRKYDDERDDVPLWRSYFLRRELPSKHSEELCGGREEFDEFRDQEPCRECQCKSEE